MTTDRDRLAAVEAFDALARDYGYRPENMQGDWKTARDAILDAAGATLDVATDVDALDVDRLTRAWHRAFHSDRGFKCSTDAEMCRRIVRADEDVRHAPRADLATATARETVLREELGWRDHLNAVRRLLVGTPPNVDSVDAAIGYALNDCEATIAAALGDQS